MRICKKIYLILIVIIFLLSFSGCNMISHFEASQAVAVFMPCQNERKWSYSAEEIEQILISEGYQVYIYYADKDSSLQEKQINDAISKIDAMIISPVDTANLSHVLDEAGKNGVKVIAFDRLPLNTAFVDYFVTFDNYLIGADQALSLLDGLSYYGDGPYNIEIFAGETEDSNAVSVYQGAMSVLEPLIENGTIVVLSGMTDIDDIATTRGNNQDAILRFENLLKEYYSDGTPLHGVLSPRDNMSLEFIRILETNTSYISSVYPVITGQNAMCKNVLAIADSLQYSTIYKDYKLLSQIACSMVTAVLNGQIPEVNDSTTFNNGSKVVPAFLCEPILVSKENYESILIDSGYMKSEDIFTGD